MLWRKFFSRLTSIQIGIWEEKLSIHVPPITTSFRSHSNIECLGVKDTILQINGWQSKRNNYLNIFMGLRWKAGFVSRSLSFVGLLTFHMQWLWLIAVGHVTCVYIKSRKFNFCLYFRKSLLHIFLFITNEVKPNSSTDEWQHVRKAHVEY